MLPKLKPLGDFPADDRRAVKFVLFDIDDTLTSGGRLTGEAYGALEDLKAAGLVTAAITGGIVRVNWLEPLGEVL